MHLHLYVKTQGCRTVLLHPFLLHTFLVLSLPPFLDASRQRVIRSSEASLQLAGDGVMHVRSAVSHYQVLRSKQLGLVATRKGIGVSGYRQRGWVGHG